ncbi:MAG: hypothetical protein HPY62_13945, partial [Bacteroidales bacterium]|nr:hypothetical protein [Bacteroidales bacterium]
MKEYSDSVSNRALQHHCIPDGTQVDESKPLQLTAGNLSMIYENGAVRYIKAGVNELIRMIYQAVRDKEWLTINPVKSEEVINVFPDSFIIKYKSLYKSGESELISKTVIIGNPDSSVVFSFEGEALTPFEKNRAGICVLHPVEGYSGQACEITRPDGQKEYAEFPVNIAPFQPFTDIKSMKCCTGGFDYTLNFEGDIFETEDQRNWTDASYKTYSTPLRLPFPVTLEIGKKINQKVEFRLTGRPVSFRKIKRTETLTLFRNCKISLPKIGICRSSRPQPLTETEIQILSKLGFDHYRIDLHLFDISWIDTAERAVAEAKRLGYKTEFALFFDDQASKEAIAFIEWLKNKDLSPAVILLLHKSESTTPDCVADSLAIRLKNAFPDVKIATGTNANFAQLNRYRPASKLNDLICYSIHPQEHASDLRTLAENTTAQKDTVMSAKTFSSGKGIWVSPINIQRRFNANTEYYEKPYTGSGVPPQIDPRLMSLFGAAWTIGSLKYLTESEPAGVSYFET